jgi:hypothetical protein
MIVWLASYPRSGNTFFRIVLHHAYNLNTYSLYNDPELEKIGVADVVGHEAMPASIDELRAAKEVYFVKTHELPGDSDPAIYIVRDGRDALVSHAKYVESFKEKKRRSFLKSEQKAFEERLEKLIATKPRFGGWSNNVRDWLNRPGAKTVLVRYEDLVKSPQGEVERTLTELGFNLQTLTGGVVPDFAALQARSPEFFRKGKTNAWREDMPERLHELFWQHHQPMMEQLGYLRAGS